MKIYLALIAIIITLVSCEEETFRPETIYDPEKEKTSSVQNITVATTGVGAPVVYISYFIRKQVQKEGKSTPIYSLKGNCHINGVPVADIGSD